MQEIIDSIPNDKLYYLKQAVGETVASIDEESECFAPTGD